MSGDAIEFGFVAALEREVSGLVHGWSSTNERIAGIERRIYQKQNAALLCAGTGVGRAYAAAKLLIEKRSPEMLISIGFAGACVPEPGPGGIVVPATVLEAGTGNMFPCAFGRGQVVTLDRVAGRALKQCSAARFGAVAVEMEAAGVAAAASECGREFAAIKAISDGADEDLGFLADFVRPEGFATGRFIAHIAFRPGLWPSVVALQRNSKLASMALHRAVDECMGGRQAFIAKYSPDTARV